MIPVEAATSLVNQTDTSRLRELTAEGWRRIKDEIVFIDQPQRRPSWLKARRLREAGRLYLGALKIDPDSVGSLWALGKIHQRLRDFDLALNWFHQALALVEDNVELWREASACALQVGKAEEALSHALRAISLQLDDAGLMANLALAYLIGGDVARAKAIADQAAERQPDDGINQRVAALVSDVLAGRMPRPSAMRDLQTY